MASAVMPEVLIGGGTTSTKIKGFDVLPEQVQKARFVPMAGPIVTPDSALPQRVLFGALRHPALRLLDAIPLRTERSEAGISVIWDEVQEFGFGDTFGDAVTDFAATIAELYLELQETEALSADLSAIRETLSRYIDARPHEGA